MERAFDYFVVFAEMRTGSNFLETNLNAYPGLTCYGEAFNPHFVGYPNRDDILGVTLKLRAADPGRLVQEIIRNTEGLGGFRFFHDHDPRVLEFCLKDPRCAKIILTRNPLDSYVSWKIAQATGQWKLTDVRRRKDGRARYDDREFNQHLGRMQDFQIKVQHALQTNGQTAFHIHYDDLHDIEVMNGLARFLGETVQMDAVDDKLKRQNPAPLSEKVENYSEMRQALAGYDHFNLSRTPNFEPRRGAKVPGYIAAPKAPLLFMPIKSTPVGSVSKWLAAMDGKGQDSLLTNFNQKSLREWLQDHVGHRSFTVVRHPVARAHTVFCERILTTGATGFNQIRKTLRKIYDLPVPKQEPGEDWDAQSHRAAFLGYLDFVKKNLSGQTNIRVDGHWLSQASSVQGFSEYSSPDLILREDELGAYLPALAKQAGRPDAPEFKTEQHDYPVALSDIYDEEIEKRVANVYQRDYLAYGFGPWG